MLEFVAKACMVVFTGCWLAEAWAIIWCKRKDVSFLATYSLLWRHGPFWYLTKPELFYNRRGARLVPTAFYVGIVALLIAAVLENLRRFG